MLNQPFLMLMLAVLLMTVLVSTAAPSLQQMKSPASGGMANGVLHLMAAAEGGAALGERLSALRETLNSTLERARDELDDRFERNGRELGVRRWRRKHARATAKANASSLPSTAGAFDARCHAREHTGYAGDGAVVWGLGKPGFHLPDAPTCCRACIAHNEVCSLPESRGKRWWPDRPDMRCGGDPSTACTIWTFCPIDRCFAFDIHKHEFGECWLKFQKGTDPPYTQPKDPHFGHTKYPEIMRHAPRKIWPWAVSEEIWPGPMPEDVPWMSGVIAEPSVEIVSSPPNDKWRERWCKKHGPCD